MRKPFRQSRLVSAWHPPTGPGYAPIEQTTEVSNIPYSKSQSKPADNRLATTGWALTTKTRLLSAVSRISIGSWFLLFHATRLWSEVVSTMMWNLSFKTARQSYNSLEMDKYLNTPDQRFSGVEFQMFLQPTTPGAAPYFSYKPHCGYGQLPK